MIELSLDKMEAIAIKESLQLMKNKLETPLGGNMLGAPQTIEFVGKVLSKVNDEIDKTEENEPKLTTPTENDYRIVCPKCGSHNAYGNLAGEWCEDCDYDTITEY